MENARRRCFILLFLRKNTLPLSFGVSPTAAFFYPSAKPPRFCGRIFFRKRKFWYVFFLRVSCRNALRLFTADFPQNPPRARPSAIFTERAFPQTDSCAHLRRSAPFFFPILKFVLAAAFTRNCFAFCLRTESFSHNLAADCALRTFLRKTYPRFPSEHFSIRLFFPFSETNGRAEISPYVLSTREISGD